MKKLSHLIFILILVFAYAKKSKGQGCSDAGACSIGHLNPLEQNEENAKLSTIGIAETFAIGEQNVLVSTTELSYSYQFENNFNAEIKFPFLDIRTGNLASTVGLGDVTLSLSKVLDLGNKNHLGLSIGGKLPLNNANQKEDGRSLPMVYQSSQGTYDLLLAANFQLNKWVIAAAYQHAFNRNQNQFLRTAWLDDADAQEYFESRELKRGDDVVLRFGRNFDTKENKHQFYAGLLGIYRIQKDEIKNKLNQNIQLKGSEGLTLNLTGAWNHTINKTLGIGVSAGFPVVVRDYRADGLTRSFVMQGKLNIKI